MPCEESVLGKRPSEEPALAKRRVPEEVSAAEEAVARMRVIVDSFPKAPATKHTEPHDLEDTILDMLIKLEGSLAVLRGDADSDDSDFTDDDTVEEEDIE